MDINDLVSMTTLLYMGGNFMVHEIEQELVTIKYPQASVLYVLWKHNKEMYVGDIAKELFQQAQTTSTLLKRLEISGYITKRTDPYNKKRVLVKLTDRGRKLLEAEILPVLRGIREKYLKGFRTCSFGSIPKVLRQMESISERRKIGTGAYLIAR